jgi:AcrR family transcriptional regulator
MPATRPGTSRNDKARTIVDAAVSQVVSAGYEGLSVVGVARGLGLAPNSVYWYFPSKDALFVAALESVLSDLALRKPPSSRSLISRLLWFTDELQPIWEVMGPVHQRRDISPVMQDFASSLDDLIEAMLTNGLRGIVPASNLSRAVPTVRATVEGTYSRRLDRGSRHRILRFLLVQLASSR